MTFQNFIVLGLIPGTHIQITFGFWLDIILALAVLAAAHWTWQHVPRINALIVGLYVGWTFADWQPYGPHSTIV